MKPQESEMWKAFTGKRDQLYREINESEATIGQKRDMGHTVEKLCMFASDVMDDLSRKTERLEEEISMNLNKLANG